MPLYLLTVGAILAIGWRKVGGKRRKVGDIMLSQRVHPDKGALFALNMVDATHSMCSVR